MQTNKFFVEDMHCSSCAMRLEGLEDDLPGVEEVKANYRKHEMEVRFDESRLSVEQIISSVKKLGYTARLEN